MKNIAEHIQEKSTMKYLRHWAYGFLFFFFLLFSPLFYDIHEQQFLFEVGKEIWFIFLILIWILLVNILWFLKQKSDSNKLNNALSLYVDKEVAKAVLAKNGEVKLSGKKKKVSIFFSDIENFTQISNDFTPEELVCFLKEYFSIMSSNIQKHNGYIDKYEWDCIMALWWAFHTMQKDSYDTCLSAIKQQKALKILNIKFKKTLWQEVKVRIGINTGEAVLGNIGAKGKKVEYTALWDNVNIASRLEGVNKYYGTYTCVSEYIYNECVDFFDFREIDTVILKWRNTKIRVFELIDEIWKTAENGEYQKAANIFQKLKNIDAPSAVMELRCKNLLKKVPNEHWDFAWKMESK